MIGVSIGLEKDFENTVEKGENFGLPAFSPFHMFFLPLSK